MNLGVILGGLGVIVYSILTVWIGKQLQKSSYVKKENKNLLLREKEKAKAHEQIEEIREQNEHYKKLLRISPDMPLGDLLIMLDKTRGTDSSPKGS